ncbi:MAG: DegT/DnrJ/EryC1/StrS family aminotransferase [Planctomycetes bacterium]|nr:DegT/DnrJ/EryC1/StrS family aminotransferase [Planctomycetota bacterium]
MSVPFVDLRRQYEALKPAMDETVLRVIGKGMFILGDEVERFEQEFAAYCGVRHAIGVASGLDGLRLVLRALGLGPGDEVITPPNSFIATAIAITDCGARPVFVDIDPETYNLDLAKLEAAITPRTRAILPVHLYGQPVHMDVLLDVARRRGVPVFEDACQAHGAEWRGKRAGSFGVAAAFSFYPAKNLGCYGDGGAVVTSDDALAEKVRVLRHVGQSEKYKHPVRGYNARLDELQAAVLRVKLPKLDSWNDGRRRVAKLYAEALRVPEVRLPSETPGAKHIYHVYCVRAERRDALLDHLKARGIGALIHYPIPIHRQGAYADLGLAEGSFPVTERTAREIVSLPMFPEMTEAEVREVAAAVQSFYRGGEAARAH